MQKLSFDPLPLVQGIPVDTEHAPSKSPLVPGVYLGKLISCTMSIVNGRPSALQEENPSDLFEIDADGWPVVTGEPADESPHRESGSIPLKVGTDIIIRENPHVETFRRVTSARVISGPNLMVQSFMAMSLTLADGKKIIMGGPHTSLFKQLAPDRLSIEKHLSLGEPSGQVSSIRHLYGEYVLQRNVARG